jgi:pimeloyl-ACP methyl ester carboxylesterase
LTHAAPRVNLAAVLGEPIVIRRTFTVVIALLLGACTGSEPPAGLLGAYALEDGRTVSIRRSPENSLRYRIYEDGTSGRLYAAADGSFVSGEGFTAREPVVLRVDFATNEDGVAETLAWSHRDQPALTGTRIGREQAVWIESGGTRLFGRLHLPDREPPVAAVVLVHGSGDSPGTEWFYNGDFFVANGFAVLAYDKRGTGRSEGEFTFDFEQLADDAGAAAGYLAGHPDIDSERIGLCGYSQGGWVAPLAASRHDIVSFVMVSYGMVESPAEEARLEMRQLLLDADVADDELREADELIRASVDLVASEFEEGWPRFEELKQQFRDAGWLEYLDGTPVGRMVSYPKWLVELVGRRLLLNGLDWYYDSTALLEQSDVPMAWLLAAEDRSAPNEQTIAFLRALIGKGRPVSLTVFPDAGHGMVMSRKDGDEVTYTGYAPGYFRKEVEELRRLSRQSRATADR